MNGNWPDEEARKQGGEIERDTYQWLLMIQKAEASLAFISARTWSPRPPKR